jgi:hypothetical protein
MNSINQINILFLKPEHYETYLARAAFWQPVPYKKLLNSTKYGRYLKTNNETEYLKSDKVNCGIK